MINLVIIGAGGFALEVVDLIEQINMQNIKYKIIGFLDDNKSGEILPNHNVIGPISSFEDYIQHSFVIAIANPHARNGIFKNLKSKGVKTPNLIHPESLVSNYVDLKSDSGIIINAYSTLSSKCKISEGVIIDSNVYIGHESIIMDFVTIYAGTLVSGNVEINHCSQIGLGSRVIQGNKIGSNTFIGAGSTVISNIQDNVVAVGTPCKVIKENK